MVRSLVVRGTEIKGALFDADDLLVVVELCSKLAWLSAILTAADLLERPEWAEQATMDFLLQFNGVNADGRRRLCLERFGPSFPFDVLLKARTQALNITQRTLGVQQMPGAVQVCAWMRRMGIPICVVTSSSTEEAVLKLEKAGLLPHFRDGHTDNLVTGSMVPKGRGKPAPDPFLMGAAKLGVPARHCLGFEDSKTGILSVAAAEAIPVMIPGLVPADDEDRQLAGKGELVFPSLMHAIEYFDEHLV